jgi:phosphate-selective porin OprO/OprP
VQKGKKRMFVVRPAIVAALAAVIFIGRPGSARAQGSGPITLEGADYTLQMGALIQLDGRFAIDDPLNAVGDTFVLRRVRPILQGRVAKFFDFRLMPDFGNGTVVLFDAYFDTRFSDALRLRVGKDKTPIGLEQLQADYSVLFPERTLVTNLVPNRDVGMQAQGSLARGMLSCVGAVFNGVPDAANGDIDANDGKDVVGRVTVQPFARAAGRSTLGVALAGSTGDQTGALPSFKSTDQQIFFSNAAATIADGARTRVSPSVFFYKKAFGAFGEYVRSTQAVSKGTQHADLSHRAWETTVSLVVTGEPASDRGVTPRRRCDPEAGTWGAFQIAARYASLQIDPDTFTLGLASAGASRRADAGGVSATWYPNQYVKYVLSYEPTVFDQAPDGPRRAEHAVVFRLQVNVQPSS